MTAGQRSASRFVLAPVVDGGAAWDRGVDLVLAPLRLSNPVHVLLPDRRPGGDR